MMKREGNNSLTIGNKVNGRSKEEIYLDERSEIRDHIYNKEYATWHPCTQMKDYQVYDPLEIKSARGSYIYTKDGKKIIDAISSWWCKSLGHNHEDLKKAMVSQMDRFEHVMSANTTNDILINLSNKLGSYFPKLNKVFYAGDGSSAVEVALKLSLQSRFILGERKRNKFIALTNGYHGDTTGAMSVSDIGRFKDPYHTILFNTHYIKDIPYVSDNNDPLWDDCSEYWKKIEPTLDLLSETATAVILEPVVQGAGGIKIYSADFLKRLRSWTKKNNIYLIADEIMTGIGRTGKMFACEHSDVVPDIICTSKGLTSGWLPFSAVIIHEDIYQIFYDDYAKGNNFLHSHTYSGNVLGAVVALKTLEIIERENILDKVSKLEQYLKENMEEVSKQSGVLSNTRSIGCIVAADIISDKDRVGFLLSKEAANRGALLRPIGNTLYWMPPLNVDKSTIRELKDITIRSIERIIG